MIVSIESLDSRHSASIQALASDPEIARTSDIPSPLPPDGAGAWIDRMKALEDQGAGFVFAIVCDNRVVGACGLWRLGGLIFRSGELGFFIGKPYWGRGYATAGSRLLLAYGFNELGLSSVRSSCLAWNIGAWRVLSGLGFKLSHEGPSPPGSKFPATENYQYWVLTRKRWRSTLETTSLAV